MNPVIENELRLHVMSHVNFTKTVLNEPINKNIWSIKLQPLQFLTSFIDTKSKIK